MQHQRATFDESSRHTTDEAGRKFLKAITEAFQCVEHDVVRAYVSPADATNDAIKLADNVFAAFPMPDAMINNSEVQQIMVDAHHAHLALIRSYGEEEYKEDVAMRAHTTRTFAMKRMQNALQSAKYKDRFDVGKRKADLLHSIRMTFGDAQSAPQGSTEQWTRGDIAAAVNDGEYDTLSSLVRAEYMNNVSVLQALKESKVMRTEDVSSASTLINLERTHKLGRFDIDPDATLDQKKARDIALGTVRRALQRTLGEGRRMPKPGFSDLVAAAERIAKHPYMACHNPDSTDSVVNAATRYLVHSSKARLGASGSNSKALLDVSKLEFGEIDRHKLAKIASTMSQSVVSVWRWLYAIVVEQDDLVKRLEVRNSIIDKQLENINNLKKVDGTFESAHSLVRRYAQRAHEQFQVEKGYAFFTPAEDEYRQLPYLEAIARRISLYNLWKIEGTVEENAADVMRPRVIDDFVTLLTMVKSQNKNYQDDLNDSTVSPELLATLRQKGLRSMMNEFIKKEIDRSPVTIGLSQREPPPSSTEIKLEPQVIRVVPVIAMRPAHSDVPELDDPFAKAALEDANRVLQRGRDGESQTTLAQVMRIGSEQQSSNIGHSREEVLVSDDKQMAVSSQYLDAKLVDARELIVDGKLLDTDPDSGLEVQHPQPQSILISNSGYNTAQVWEQGFNGPLPPVDVELYMSSTTVASGSKIARFVQMINYAHSVGVLQRDSSGGLFTRAQSSRESLLTFFEKFVNEVAAESRVRKLDMQKWSVGAVMTDLVQYARENVVSKSITVAELAEGDRMLPAVPPAGTELHERALFVIDSYVNISQQENIQIAYTLGPILTLLRTDEASRQQVQGLSTIIIGTEDEELDFDTREQIRAHVESTQVDQLEKLHSQLLHSEAAPAAENFRRLTSSGDGSKLTGTNVLMRRVDGGILGEKYSDTILELVYSVPRSDDDTEEELAARRTLARNTNPRMHTYVRIDERLSCAALGLETDSDQCRALTITDTVDVINPETASRVQVHDTLLRTTLTMRIMDKESRKLIDTVFSDVQIGGDEDAPIGTQSARSLLAESKRLSDARYGSDERRSALKEIVTLFRETSTDDNDDEGDGSNTITNLFTRLLHATLLDPLLNVSEILKSSTLTWNLSNDVMRAHSIAFASLEYLVSMYSIARTTGSFAVAVLSKIGFIDRTWSACSSALNSVCKSLRLHIAWAMAASIVRWAIDLSRGTAREKKVNEAARKMMSLAGKSSANYQVPSNSWWEALSGMLEQTMAPQYVSYAKKLVQLLRALIGTVTRMIGALITVFIGSSASTNFISIGILGTLRVASLWFLVRTMPIWGTNLQVFAMVILYRLATRYMLSTSIDLVQRSVQSLISTVSTEERAAASARAVVLVGLLTTRIAPYLIGYVYPVAAVIPGVNQLTTAFDPIAEVFPAMISAMDPGTDPGIELTVFAGRAVSNILYPLFVLWSADRISISGSAVHRRRVLSDLQRAFDSTSISTMAIENRASPTATAAWLYVVEQAITCNGIVFENDESVSGTILRKQTKLVIANFIKYINSRKVHNEMPANLQLEMDEHDLSDCSTILKFAFATIRAPATIKACSQNVSLESLKNEWPEKFSVVRPPKLQRSKRTLHRR